MRRAATRLRHWKQKFNKNAEFIWCRNTKYAGREYLSGDIVPDDLKAKPAKLRRLWESRRIQLADFDEGNVCTGEKEDYSWLDEDETEVEVDGDADTEFQAEAEEYMAEDYEIVEPKTKVEVDGDDEND